jgi:phosphatidylglycerophosphate synthase
MPSIYNLKPQFQGLLRPITRRLAAAGITANQVTVTAAVLSAAVGAAVALLPESRWPLLLVPIFLFIRMALNAIDGMLAREHGMKSDPGLVLNEIGDVVADAALYLPFALIPDVPSSLVVTVVVLGIVSEMTGVVAVQLGQPRRYDGPLGKSDRAFLFGLIGLVLGCGVEPGRWLHVLLWIAIALAVATIVNRSRRAIEAARLERLENHAPVENRAPVENPRDMSPARSPTSYRPNDAPTPEGANQ